MRNLLATVPKSAQGAVAAIVRTIFAQPDHASAMAQLKRVADGLRPRFTAAAELLESAAEDVLAFMHFPEEHPWGTETHSCWSEERSCFCSPRGNAELPHDDVDGAVAFL